MGKITKIILAVAVASATAAGSAVGVAEHKIAGDERKRLRDERRRVIKTEAVKGRFGKTKYVHREVTVDGYGKEV